ncbi:hypothetical protein [Plantibacter flavus]|uniref:hypothetical protein n=1 Tax=Plantibacter flavus TaxID=150123 RepID=UPI0033962C86
MSGKEQAWALFDRIVEEAAPNGEYRNPWVLVEGVREYKADIETLERLLAVPLYLGSTVRSGIRALALDVWLAYELRRSGFDEDAVWPRATHPRILPMPISRLLRTLPKSERSLLLERLTKKNAVSGVTSSSASILGKNYLKQVDVIMTDWATGPEILISTKRMDSSYGKNAPNRVEESYGDAKNLRLRHPMAALGFLIALRSDILTKEPLVFDWMTDLVGKLGQEDDAYHATCVLLMDYADGLVDEDDSDVEEPDDPLTEPGVEDETGVEDMHTGIPGSDLDSAFKSLPRVSILENRVEAGLRTSVFLAQIVNRALDATPINLHVTARQRRRSPLQ